MKKSLALFFALALLLSACSGNAPVNDTNHVNDSEPDAAAEPVTLTVMTHDSFAVSEEVIAAFEAETGIEVKFLKAGDTGAALNKAILAGEQPLADVFYGVDNTFLSRALEEGVFETYASPLLAKIPDEFKLDPSNHALPVDYGDVCINYDIAFFAQVRIAVPTSLDDLLKPEYANLLVVENPATSSPGLAFLFTTISVYGEEGYLDYWAALMDNGTKVVNDWETAYNIEFSRWGGEYPMVVSYGSSPPFEVLYAEEELDSAPTAAIAAPGMCFRQIEFVGILKGTQNRGAAEQWVDFMLSTQFQEDMPWQMYVFPVNADAQLDPTFVEYLAVPDQPAMLDPAAIAANREQWLSDWQETVFP